MMIQKSLIVCLMFALLRNYCVGISINDSISHTPEDQVLYTFNWTRVRHETCLMRISNALGLPCLAPSACRSGNHGVECEYGSSQSYKKDSVLSQVSSLQTQVVCSETVLLKCPRGTYGEGCTHKCQATCRDSCHHTDSRCLGGCVDGWTGDTCQHQVPASESFPDPANIALFVVGISLTILSTVCMVCFIYTKCVNARQNRERNVDLNVPRTQQIIYVEGNVQISCTQARAPSEPESGPSVEEENVYEPLQPERAEREGDSTYQDLH